VSPTGADRGIAWRLFLTVWLVYSVFATTNVVRETYLAISLGTRATVRVDEYLGLHPDLFEIPGRGGFINSNPGASIVGALPYAVLVRPAITLAVRLKPEIAQPKPPATYDDPRPNRTKFMNAARERGLDIVLGLAALGTAVTVMAPLGALAALLMFLFLRERLDGRGRALAWSLVFAFATPMLFRSAFLNQNAIVAHLVLAAWILKVGLTPGQQAAIPAVTTLASIGMLLGFAIVCDYSGIPLAVVFGVWILSDGWNRGGVAGAMREGAIYSIGAVASLSVLLAYQWVAFGHPIWPAQRYMPPTEFSVRGWFGFTLPSLDLLWRNLFDLRYGLFAFCPLLIAALAAPFAKPRGWSLSRREVGWIYFAFVALLLFSSANQFANLQWNTGVRYMVPVVPLLFIAAIPTLEAMPRAGRWSLVALSMVITLAVSMTREDVPTALRMLASEGPTLPVLIVLRKMSSGYDVNLPPATFGLIAFLITVILVLVWRPVWRRARQA
jgi:hypothetical protein